MIIKYSDQEQLKVEYSFLIINVKSINEKFGTLADFVTKYRLFGETNGKLFGKIELINPAPYLIEIINEKLIPLGFEDKKDFVLTYERRLDGYGGDITLLNKEIPDCKNVDWLGSVITRQGNFVWLKAKYEKTPLIEFMERKGLNPKPGDNNTISWVAKCPTLISQHNLTVTTYPHAWHCMHCDRKGGLKELEQWFNELDQKKLSGFMKEINSGGIRLKETLQWWLKRY